MEDSLFDRGDRLLANPAPLDVYRHPDEARSPVAREPQIRQLEALYAPLREGECTGLNVVAYGPPDSAAVGKTTSVREVLYSIDDAEIIEVPINHQQNDRQTVISVLDQLREARGGDDTRKSTEKTVALFDAAIGELAASDRPTHLVFDCCTSGAPLSAPDSDLDEMDPLPAIWEFLARSKRARLDGGRTGAPDAYDVTVILTDETQFDECGLFGDYVDATVYFDGYDADDLEEILSDRAEDAFVDGAVDTETIRHCAESTLPYAANAPRVLRLLREAWHCAEREDADAVRMEHVDAVTERWDLHELRAVVDGSTPRTQLLLWILATRQKKRGGPVRTAEIQSHRKTLETDLEGDSWSDAYVRERLKELEARWPFLEREQIAGGRGEGVYYEYQLQPDCMAALEAIETYLSDHLRKSVTSADSSGIPVDGGSDSATASTGPESAPSGTEHAEERKQESTTEQGRPEEGDETRSVRDHLEIQHALVQLGRAHQHDVFVARNDRSESIDGTTLGEGCVDTLPLRGLPEKAAELIEYIDVIWLDGDSIVKMFEVENSTQIYSGLLRMADFAASVPNLMVDLYVVVPESRAETAEQHLSRPSFQQLLHEPEHITVDSKTFAEIRRLHDSSCEGDTDFLR
ncbi:Cdc6/Cdc18 family protein [Haloglomus salinum]|uniref:Cdc6/Cdc18 family protein n=1 Tax=Haloglomus salinum TaxID=2962673 RepID=UPI0020C97677|nr:hypothetical protein [Haloglomus salinum]